MAENNFLIFNESNSPDQTMSDADYLADQYRQNGVIPMIADPIAHNKMYRQWSIMAKSLGDFLAQQGFDANDSDAATLTQNIAYAIGTVSGEPLQEHEAKLIGTEEGVHGIRFWGNALAWYDPTIDSGTGQPIGWTTIETGGGSGGGDVLWSRDGSGQVVVATDGKMMVSDGNNAMLTNTNLSDLAKKSDIPEPAPMPPIVWQVDADPSVISLSRNIATGEVFNFFAKVSNSANATMNDGTGALPVVFLTGLGANNDTISISENMFVPGQIYEITKTATEYVAAIVLEWFFDTPTTQIWQCPKTGYYAISAVGGGGAAGNILAGSSFSGASGGGGAGGYAVLHNYFIKKGTTYSYTVGRGGRNTDSGLRNGTSSIFNNTLIASYGGQGGDADSYSRTRGGGTGGSALGGDDNFPGQAGFGSHVSLQSLLSGAGGYSFWGPGGNEIAVASSPYTFPGNNAHAPGGGGGGACRSTSAGSTIVRGGSGGDGRIHIKYQSNYFKH